MNQPIEITTPKQGHAAGTCGWLAEVLDQSWIEVGRTRKTGRAAAWLISWYPLARDSAGDRRAHRSLLAMYDYFDVADRVTPTVEAWPFEPNNFVFIGTVLTEAAMDRVQQIAQAAASSVQRWMDESDSVNCEFELVEKRD